MVLCDGAAVIIASATVVVYCNAQQQCFTSFSLFVFKVLFHFAYFVLAVAMPPNSGTFFHFAYAPNLGAAAIRGTAAELPSRTRLATIWPLMASHHSFLPRLH